MKKLETTKIIRDLILAVLIFFTANTYGEKQDSNKPSTPTDLNIPYESKRLVPKLSSVDPNAQYALGLMYYNGQYIPQDYNEAVEWFTKAAEQGYANAQYALGLMYREGKGVPQDYNKAVEWFTKSAKQGNANAQYALGLTYYNGQDVPQDYEKAVEWFTKAAEQGKADAQFFLGSLYHEGEGVPQDYKKAVEWFTKAAEQGDADAQFFLGSLYYIGEGVSKDYKEADKWYTKAAEQGNANAQYVLGSKYYIGEGVSRDYKESVKWYTKAAEQGNAVAQFNLGKMYYEGKGVPRDYKEAAKWFTKSAEQGYATAQGALGKMYHEGEGVPEDYVIAYKWIILAVAQIDKLPQEMQKDVILKGRDEIKQKMSREQIAEAQELARRFKPIISAQQKDADIQIQQRYKKDQPVSTGTGFFITADGFFVTAFHLVKDAREMKILTERGLQKALLVKFDPANDVAILKVEEDVYSPLTIKPSLGVKTGDEVFTVGFPNVGLQGFEPKYTKGNISSLTGFQDDPRYFQISIPVQTGNSGGPLVNKNGDVIGVVVARLGDIETLIETGALPQNVNYAIKSSYVLTLLETMPQIYRNLKSPSQKEAIQADLVEQTQKSVCLVLCY